MIGGRFDRSDAIQPYLELRQKVYEALGVSKALAKEEEAERLYDFFGENDHLKIYLNK